jgi:ribosome biogenesis protein
MCPAFTASWDHAVKLWDLERQDCLQTLNGSKVVTSLAASPSAGRLLAAGHPDGRVRLWDLRAPAGGPDAADGAEAAAAPERRALAPCGSWISGVAWVPGREAALASVSHDGKLRVWDLRATKPLFTVDAHGGEKALALCAFAGAGDDPALFTGGADGFVRRFELP